MDLAEETRTLPPEQAAGRGRYADQHSPLIRDAWYVAALSDEVGVQPIHRRILGTDIVLYRTGAGEPVALLDRCPHRGFPLSRGRRDGDLLACGYHGMAFAPDGKCVRLPGDSPGTPNLRIAAFEVRERAPLVWIRLEATERSDGDLPDTASLASPSWKAVGGYFHVPANYVAMHENLMDLSHFSYLHTDTVGTADYAGSSLDFYREGGRVRIERALGASAPPAIFVALTGCPPDTKVDRFTQSSYWSPGAQVGTSRIVHAAGQEAVTATTHIYHFITPESQDSFHYWWFMARDFLVDDAGVDANFVKMTTKAFAEDRDALIWMSERISAGDGFKEHSFLQDRPGLAAREELSRRARSQG